MNTKHGTAFPFLKYARSSILFTVLKLERTKTENMGTNQRLEIPSTEVSTIEAMCINCNKRFKTMHAVSMHLRVTARRHSVNFINYGIYDKRTSLKETTLLEN